MNRDSLPENTAPPDGALLISAWSLVLMLIFLALGLFAVMTVAANKRDSNARHMARIDPHSAEPGYTPPEENLPDDPPPRKVVVGVYLENIASISILESYWEPAMYLWFDWSGDDMHPGKTFKLIDGEILSSELINESRQGDRRHALYFVKARITKFFDTMRFPVDDHLLTITLEDREKPWSELRYVPDSENSGISSRVRMPGFIVHRTDLAMKPHTYRTNFGDLHSPPGGKKTASQWIFGVWNRRAGLGMYSKVFIGLFAATAIAVLAMFVKPTNVDPRFGMGVGGFFGAVANTLVASALVPDSGVMTLMDMVNGFGMITIFLTLVQSAISLHLYETCGEVTLSRRFDRISFLIFAAGSLSINLLIPFVGMVR